MRITPMPLMIMISVILTKSDRTTQELKNNLCEQKKYHFCYMLDFQKKIFSLPQNIHATISFYSIELINFIY
ncbi:MAG: hypothetical protein O4860_07995 [Trichodesmium sp. St2_bin2_1]|nr:hypothetical protein [Trichodesmium sp. St2_bin2_1]